MPVAVPDADAPLVCDTVMVGLWLHQVRVTEEEGVVVGEGLTLRVVVGPGVPEAVLLGEEMVCVAVGLRVLARVPEMVDVGDLVTVRDGDTCEGVRVADWELAAVREAVRTPVAVGETAALRVRVAVTAAMGERVAVEAALGVRVGVEAALGETEGVGVTATHRVPAASRTFLEQSTRSSMLNRHCGDSTM